MPPINHIKILKDAWNITWKNKFLWWFGLLIALGSPGMNFNFNPGGDENINDSMFQKASDFIIQNIHWVITGIIFFAIILIILTIIGIIARAGLIKSIDSICKNKTANFKQGMREGKKYLGKLFLLGLSIFFLVFTSMILLSLPVIFLAVNKAYAFAIFLGILAFLILIPAIALATFLYIFGSLYTVLADLKLWNALEKSYELLRKNLLSSIIMYLLFIPINLALFIAGATALILIAVIFILIGLAMYAIFSKIGAIVTGIGGLFIFLVIAMAVKSVFETFVQSVWYLFFLEIAKPKTEEKVEEEILERKEEVLPVPDPIKTAGIEK